MVNVLEELGLRKNKAVIYIAGLQASPASAAEIATKAHLPRTTTIEILEHLVTMGLVSYVLKGRKRIYVTEPPEKLKILLQERERRLQDILPQLKSFQQSKGKRPTIRMYEGIEGVKAVFEDTLTSRYKTLLGILSMADLYKIPGKKYMDHYVERRIAKDYSLRVIRSEQKDIEETWPSSTSELRSLRYAPQGIIFPMTMYIYDQKVGIIGTEKEAFGTIIESADFYQTQKNLFEIVWDVSRQVKEVNNTH